MSRRPGILAAVLWCAGWVYLAALGLVLFFLLFIESVPYFYLVLLPIPVLAPVYLLERLYGWRLYGTVYLFVALLTLGALLAGRVWLDVWFPLEI